MFRSLLVNLARDRSASTGRATSIAAGLSIAFGIGISFFYLTDGREFPTGLAVIGLLLLAVGLWIDRLRTGCSEAKRLRRSQFLVSMACVLALMIQLVEIRWVDSVSAGVLAISVLMLPLVVSMAGRADSEEGHPPQVAFAVAQFGLMATLAAIEAFEAGPSLRSSPFADIALPALGALLGASVYLFHMPWRADRAAYLNLPSRLLLGMLLGWAALELGLRPPDGDASWTAAVAWILALPVLDTVRRFVIEAMGVVPGTATKNINEHVFWHESPSPYMLLAGTIAMGGVGIVTWLRAVPEFWSLLGLAAAAVGYLLITSFCHLSLMRQKLAFLEARE